MNCVLIDDDKVTLRIVNELIEKTEDLTLLRSFSNSIDAVNFLSSCKDEIDILIIDIEMPEMTGFEILSNLSYSQVVVISSNAEHAVEAFEYDVTDFLMKPIGYSRFYKAIERSRNKAKVAQVLPDDYIFIRRSSSFFKLNYRDILFVEAMENYVIFTTETDRFTIHFTMKSIEQKLPSSMFVRVHRSYIVNTTAIKQIKDNHIVINTKSDIKSIPIGKSYKENLMSDINVIVK